MLQKGGSIKRLGLSAFSLSVRINRTILGYLLVKDLGLLAWICQGSDLDLNSTFFGYKNLASNCTSLSPN